MEILEQIVLVAHIGGGSAAILSGFIALLYRKGGRVHRAAGKVFSLSMIVMAIGASYLGYAHADVNDVVTGGTTVYFIATAWMAAKRKEGQIGPFELWAFLAVFAGVVVNLAFAYAAATSASGSFLNAPANQYFIVAGVLGLAAGLDLSVLLRGGVSGKERIARHLWRMFIALFIAVGSFFLGQMQVFPEPIRRIEILSAPVVIVFGAMLYWLARIAFTDWRAGSASRFARGGLSSL